MRSASLLISWFFSIFSRIVTLPKNRTIEKERFPGQHSRPEGDLMKRSKFSETQIISILKAVEAGRSVRDVCREHEVSDATYYKWKSKYGGMQASDIKRLRELEDENRRLKKMYAELSLEHVMLKEVLTKKL